MQEGVDRLGAGDEGMLEAGQERSPAISDRPSYKRWQLSASKNSSESDSLV